MTNNRKIELDLLRILACFVVIVIHVPIGLKFYDYPGNSVIYQIAKLYDSLSRWCIPVFTMISGCFLLNNNKKITIKSIYSKNIFRIIRIFIFWSIIYAIFDLRDEFTIKQFILRVMNGKWHMWYLFMITGLYIITPVLREIVYKVDKKILEYWIIIMFVFSIGIPFIRMIPNIESITQYVFEQINISFLGGYLIYYILGYYLYNYDINKKTENIVYILGILGLLFTVVGNIIVSIFISKDIGFSGYHCMNVFFMSIAIFVFFKNKVSKWKWIQKYSNRIYDISSKTFGIYLIHVLLIDMISSFYYINFNAVNVFIIIFINSVVVFIIGYIIITVLSKIKYLNKFIL